MAKLSGFEKGVLAEIQDAFFPECRTSYRGLGEETSAFGKACSLDERIIANMAGILQCSRGVAFGLGIAC
jgi:hypothetical protein